MLNVSSKTLASPELTIVVAGRLPPDLPAAVATAAKRVGDGDGPSKDAVLVDGRRWCVLKLEEKPWLVGGEAWRVVGGQAAEAVRSVKATTAVVLSDLNSTEAGWLAEGLLLGDYRFTQLRSGKEAERQVVTVHLPGHQDSIEAATEAARAQNLARELADLPPNILDPATFAERAKRELRGSGATVKIIAGCAALREANFPGLAQVGAAGSAEPQLVVIHWPGRPAHSSGKKTKKSAVHLALVGKGITFDAGGISIKPPDKMWEMKADMSGAGAVLAAMTAIVKTKPAIPVTGYLCLAENLLDAKAQRPGDIYRARNGKSIHVDNTDAEGRLVLADVLTYAVESGATHVVDVATLTGACMVALGEQVAGLMGRAKDQAWIDAIRAAGQASGEEFWQLPLYGEYRKLLDHPHADLNNIGGRFGGAITAAIFLSEFVPETVAWAHLDIAGPAIQAGGWRYFAKGMTGFATRTLLRLTSDLDRG